MSAARTIESQGDLLDLLDAVATGPIQSNDRERIEAAIRADAATHDGICDPGRVREALTNQYGLDVNPRRLSATYSAMAQRGQLRFHSWGTNTDMRGGNAGRPQRLWEVIA